MVDVSNGATLYDLPDPEYRKAEGVSNSMLKQLRDRWSPALAVKRLAIKRETSDAMRFGIAFHGSLLTPNVPPTWVILPEDAPSRPTKKQVNAKKPSPETLAAIEYWKAFDEKNAGLHVLSFEQGRRLDCTIGAFKAHAMASSVLASGNAEVSVFAPFSLGGQIMRKARMDFVTSGSAIVDLKTASDCSPACVGKRDEFASQLYDLDYDMQAAYYLDLWNTANPEDQKTDFVFVAMDWDEETQHVGIRVLQCDQTVIRSGRDKYTEALTRWIGCHTSGTWEGYPQGVTMLTMPEYIARKYRTI